MRAVVYDAFGAPPSVRETEAPACPDRGVVVRVGATGVCRSDWHAWRGHDPVALPHVPGHELAGTVASVGSDVRDFHVGDRVTVPFVCGCGRCDTCAEGNHQVCPFQTQPGFTAPGSFAELVALDAADTNLVRLPDSVDFVTAASLGCRFATAFRALTSHGRVRPGDWVAVHGCGGVGLSAVMIAAALGARVIGVDVSPEARRLAESLGATRCVDGSVANVAERVRSITAGGAQISVDAVGAPGTAAASVRSLRPRGRSLQIGLLVGPGAAPELPMDLVIARELEIHGCHGMAAHDYPPMLAMITAGRLAPRRLVRTVIGLDGAPAALMAMDRPAQSAGMTVIDLTR